MAIVQPPDPDGNTFLHHAAREGDVSLIRDLLIDGYDIDARNKDGLTPLDVANQHGKPKAVVELIRQRTKRR
jgi:ankyrin repeat protein